MIPMPILTSVQRWADSHPDRPAVVVDGAGLSYAELSDRVQVRLAGTGQNTRDEASLTVISPANGLDAVVHLLAAVSGSGCVAILDPQWPDSRRAEIDALLNGWAPAGGLTDAAGSAAHPTKTPAGAPSAAPAVQPAARGLADGPAGSTFLVGFTSGTTALPKAFTRSRASWQRSLERSPEVLHLTSSDRTLAPGPLSASLNLYALFESLHAGGSFHTLGRFDLAAALASLQNDRITRLVAVPSVLRMLAGRVSAAGGVNRELRCIVSGGAALDAATTRLLQRWAPAATIVSYYGAAELGFVAAASVAPGEAGAPEENAVGQPFPGVQVRICDDDSRPVAAGQAGIIQVMSDYVCDGYLWGDDGVAFERIAGWSTVGDRGFLDASGVLHVLGRRSDMIQTAGTNVYPQEVEALLQAVPGVHAAVVTGCPDPVRGARVVAAVIADPGLAAETLLGACAAGLAGGHRPREYYRLSELPVTTAGKVSRGVLARWIAEGDSRVVHFR